ncbi:hypothetical protein [Xanthomonas graminis]|jgi:hypothetical protein|uniref:hypothetical protein n=1 Tax=Xanthomonas graminis TaxID=3390026 RepID=UPI0011152ED1|nr:hypothetical protein [Xanthomonas translucens]UKE54306.1 hypothetical protein KFS84_19755 [Xanthomonas translucens pv. graminis]WIH12211.1 hypothetical protein KM563_19870 [Xanthomonas translucens pv. graminis]
MAIHLEFARQPWPGPGLGVKQEPLLLQLVLLPNEQSFVLVHAGCVPLQTSLVASVPKRRAASASIAAALDGI